MKMFFSGLKNLFTSPKNIPKRTIAILSATMLALIFSITGVASLTQTNWFTGFLRYEAPITPELKIQTLTSTEPTSVTAGTHNINPGKLNLGSSGAQEIIQFIGGDNKNLFNTLTLQMPNNPESWKTVFLSACKNIGAKDGCEAYAKEVATELNITISVHNDSTGFGEAVSGTLEQFQTGALSVTTFELTIPKELPSSNCSATVSVAGCVKIVFAWTDDAPGSPDDSDYDFEYDIKINLPTQLTGDLVIPGSVSPFTTSFVQEFVYIHEASDPVELLIAQANNTGTPGEFKKYDDSSSVFEIFPVTKTLPETEKITQKLFFVAQNVEDLHAAQLMVTQNAVKDLVNHLYLEEVFFSYLQKNLHMQVATNNGLVVDNNVANIVANNFGQGLQINF